MIMNCLSLNSPLLTTIMRSIRICLYSDNIDKYSNTNTNILMMVHFQELIRVQTFIYFHVAL